MPATERSGRRPGRGRYRAAGRRHIGTEHILLGLLREGGGPSVCRYKERPAGWPPRRRPFPLLCTHRRNGVRKVVGRALLRRRAIPVRQQLQGGAAAVGAEQRGRSASGDASRG
ncbi:Clp protease N-terminal domain-containing protein [Micromonospora haikouensis]|uniref:Clp protease N-terminal domain-containing protein n=1 Tax=Micromonospora haikouensis TaxID=686309 RepID=UPI003D8E2E95